MIYVTGSNGLIGRYLSNKIDIVPITFRGIEPQVQFDSESVLIHLSSSISTRDDLSSIETSFRDDVSIPLKIFRQYLNSNPNGKIIFLSTAGDLHSQEFCLDEPSTENSIVNPKSLYGTHKILLENYLNLLHKEYDNFSSIVFRVSNVYGGLPLSGRVNGLIDKLLNSNEVIEIYSNLNTTINIIHIDDLVNLIIKAIDKLIIPGHQMFLVGNENHTIHDIINIISSFKKLNLIVKSNHQKSTYIDLDCTKVEEYFSWSCDNFLYNLVKN